MVFLAESPQTQSRTTAQIEIVLNWFTRASTTRSCEVGGETRASKHVDGKNKFVRGVEALRSAKISFSEAPGLRWAELSLIF